MCADTVQALPSEGPAQKRNLRVLIVDDYEGVGEVIAEGLRDHGCDCLVVASLGEGRRAFAAGIWDVVIVDVVLPDGSGVDLANLAAACKARTVVMTGYSTAANLLEQQNISFLRKPFPLNELADLIGIAAPDARIVPSEIGTH